MLKLLLKAFPTTLLSFIYMIGTIDLANAQISQKPAPKNVLPKDSDSVADLIFQLKYSENIYAQYAARVLGKKGRSVLPELLPLLKHESSDTRANAVFAISEMQAIAQPEIQEIIPLLDDKVADVRANAALAIGRIGGESAHSVIPKLIQLLSDSTTWVRSNASGSLGILGEPAKSALPSLIPLLIDDDLFVRSNASFAIANMPPSFSVPLLLEQLKAQENNKRRIAAYVLGEIPDLTRSAVPALKALRNDRDQEVRSSVTTALEKLSFLGSTFNQDGNSFTVKQECFSDVFPPQYKTEKYSGQLKSVTNLGRSIYLQIQASEQSLQMIHFYSFQEKQEDVFKPLRGKSITIAKITCAT